MERDFELGDYVRVRPESDLPARFPVSPDEVGVVIGVEKEPHARHAGYRLTVKFPRTTIPEDSGHFDLVKK